LLRDVRLELTFGDDLSEPARGPVQSIVARAPRRGLDDLQDAFDTAGKVSRRL
jgi:hypothetical protein